MPDFITIGESMVYLSPEHAGSLKHIDRFKKGLAGAETNVSIGLARLNESVGWISKLGNDPFGDFVIKEVRGEGVDTSYVTRSTSHSTGVLFKELTPLGDTNVYYYRKDSAAHHLNFDDINLDYLKSAKVVFFSGITLALSENNRIFCRKILKFCKENNILVAFDPNIRLKLWSIEEAKREILDILPYVDILTPGIEEASMLFDIEDSDKIIDLCLSIGIKTIVLKSGDKGTWVANKDERHHVPVFNVKKVVDTVGAGDAFVAGFLHSLTNNLELKECARIGNAMGAMAVQYLGDMEGLPSLYELECFLSSSKKIDR
ncbi:sugar kinase [Romboutsia lituseburensis]|uniref:sugar kinase n=1 Tax=Romboutsia lituseburensis TaxID=1537 RepID=UPI00215B2334|nr:sugar kinase [Romboutsia lituseburensis]MCR8744832.1 sugar kinase [Romboutsia lituseburensis]